MTRLNLSELDEPRRKQGPNQDYYDCPFCQDTKGHLGVNTLRNIFHCFKCGASGRTSELSFLGSFDEQVKLKLTGGIGNKKVVSNIISLPFGYEKLTEKHSNTRAYKYLEERGINEYDMEKYEIGYTFRGLFAHRIIIPIRTHKYLRYFVGRSYIGEEPKYMNAAAPKNGLLFTTHKEPVPQAVICEGIFDAISISMVMPAISPLGKTVTDEQAKSIKDYTQKAIIMLDEDAKVDAFKLYEQLSRYLPTKLVFITEKDPGEMSICQLKEVLCEYIKD